jgi:competence protein ComEC
MKIQWLFILLVLLAIPSVVSKLSVFKNEFVVWNIGQGQWTTWIHDNECWHFDVGGEFKDQIQKIRPICALRKNRIFLSHWDWDHIGFLPKLITGNWNLCLAARPGGIPKNNTRINLIKNLRPCSSNPVKKIWDVNNGDPQTAMKLKNRSNNHDSNVFYLPRIGILIPGDSTSNEEKLWLHRVPPETFGLVLGHHGSKGSSSEFLLAHLPVLKWAVASQRFRRYGHPHPEVVARLRRLRIPLLKTEEWGNIHFIL